MHDRPHEFEHKIGRWDAECSFTRPLGSAVVMLIALPCIASGQLFPFFPFTFCISGILLTCLFGRVVLCCFTLCDYTRCRFGEIFHFFFILQFEICKIPMVWIRTSAAFNINSSHVLLQTVGAILLRVGSRCYPSIYCFGRFTFCSFFFGNLVL